MQTAAHSYSYKINRSKDLEAGCVRFIGCLATRSILFNVVPGRLQYESMPGYSTVNKAELLELIDEPFEQIISWLTRIVFARYICVYHIYHEWQFA